MTENVVKLADVKWANPGDLMVTYSLGSCVGVAIWDRETKRGGMAHCLLSSPPAFSRSGCAAGTPSQGAYGKYVEVAVPTLIKGLLDRGSVRENLVACLAGGACLLEGLGDIGSQNVKVARSVLAEEGLAVAGEDVGGSHGRTMRFYTDMGRVTVVSIGHADFEMWMTECS